MKNDEEKKKESKDSNALAVQKVILEKNFETLKGRAKECKKAFSDHVKKFKTKYSKYKNLSKAVAATAGGGEPEEGMRDYKKYLDQKYQLLSEAQNAQSSAVKILVELKGLGLSDGVSESGRLKKERAKLGSMKKNMAKQFAGNCNFLTHVYSKTKDKDSKDLIVTTLKSMAKKVDPVRLRKFVDNRLKKAGNLQEERVKLIARYNKVDERNFGKGELRMIRLRGRFRGETDGGQTLNNLKDQQLIRHVKAKTKKDIQERLIALNEKSDNVSGALLSILPEEMVLASDLLYDSSQSYKNDVMKQFSDKTFKDLVDQGVSAIPEVKSGGLSFKEQYGSAAEVNKTVLACEAFLDVASQKIDLGNDYAADQNKVFGAIPDTIDSAKVENLKKDFERKLAVFKLFELEPSKRPDVRILKTKKLKPTEGITLQDSPSDESQPKSEDGWICTMNLEGTKTNLSLEFDGEGKLTNATIPSSLSTKKEFTKKDQKLISDVVNKIKVTDNKIVLRGNYSLEFQALMKQAVDARNKKDGTKIEFVAGGDIPTPAPESVEELESKSSNDLPGPEVDENVAISAATAPTPPLPEELSGQSSGEELVVSRRFDNSNLNLNDVINQFRALCKNDPSKLQQAEAFVSRLQDLQFDKGITKVILQAKSLPGFNIRDENQRGFLNQIVDICEEEPEAFRLMLEDISSKKTPSSTSGGKAESLSDQQVEEKVQTLEEVESSVIAQDALGHGRIENENSASTQKEPRTVVAWVENARGQHAATNAVKLIEVIQSQMTGSVYDDDNELKSCLKELKDKIIAESPDGSTRTSEGPKDLVALNTVAVLLDVAKENNRDSSPRFDELVGPLKKFIKEMRNKNTPSPPP